MAFVPRERMGPPPRSLAADAHDCIMARMLEQHLDHPPNTRLWRDRRHVMAGSPLIVLSAQASVAGPAPPDSCGRSAPADDGRPHIEREEQVENVPVANSELDNGSPIQGRRVLARRVRGLRDRKS